MGSQICYPIGLFFNLLHLTINRAFGCVLYEMIEKKQLFEGRKSKIVSDLLNFHEFKLELNEKLSPMFQNAIKK